MVTALNSCKNSDYLSSCAKDIALPIRTCFVSLTSVQENKVSYCILPDTSVGLWETTKRKMDHIGLEPITVPL